MGMDYVMKCSTFLYYSLNSVTKIRCVVLLKTKDKCDSSPHKNEWNILYIIYKYYNELHKMYCVIRTLHWSRVFLLYTTGPYYSFCILLFIPAVNNERFYELVTYFNVKEIFLCCVIFFFFKVYKRYNNGSHIRNM